ncbi:MAG: hypothetical protein RLZZ333_1384, partial [Bacteroidota bacterium]
MIRLFSVFVFFLTVQCSFAQINVYPSHWWMCMKSTSL